MSGEIKTFFVGKECRECEALGVFCVQPGILPVYSSELPSGPVAPLGGSAVYVDNKQALQMSEGIDSCPALTGQNTKKEVVVKIKKNAKILANRVVIDQIGNY